MAELVDALVSGTSDRKVVQVRVLFWVQKTAKAVFFYSQNLNNLRLKNIDFQSNAQIKACMYRRGGSEQTEVFAFKRAAFEGALKRRDKPVIIAGQYTFERHIVGSVVAAEYAVGFRPRPV